MMTTGLVTADLLGAVHIQQTYGKAVSSRVSPSMRMGLLGEHTEGDDGQESRRERAKKTKPRGDCLGANHRSQDSVVWTRRNRV